MIHLKKLHSIWIGSIAVGLKLIRKYSNIQKISRTESSEILFWYISKLGPSANFWQVLLFCLNKIILNNLNKEGGNDSTLTSHFILNTKQTNNVLLLSVKKLNIQYKVSYGTIIKSRLITNK